MRPKAGKARISVNPEAQQYDAALAFGWDAYWSQDESTRAMMCWHVQANRTIDAMQQYDAAHTKDR